MTEYQRLFDQWRALNAEIQGIAGNTRRAPLIARADGLKAQLRAWTVYSCKGYRYGSTNGQRPLAHCLVITKGDKAHALAAGLNQMRTYKALSFRLPPLVDVEARATGTGRLYKVEDVPIIEA